jgi:hypothetical protein
MPRYILCKVIEVAMFDACDELFPFSPCENVERARHLAAIGYQDRIVLT